LFPKIAAWSNDEFQTQQGFSFNQKDLPTLSSDRFVHID